MQPSLPFKPTDQGPWIRDVHRKLASIRQQLKPRLNEKARQYLCGQSSMVYDDNMADAINAFKKTFGLKPDDDGICDTRTWELLNEKAGTLFCEAWQYELDGLAEHRALADPTLRELRRATQALEQQTQPELRAAEQDALFKAAHGPELNALQPEHRREAIRTGEPGGTVKIRPVDEAEVRAAARAAELAGLAFSGGGIRSATFNLGILQALAEKKMLGNFDYLSTVSGGGYIGSWFSKWLKQEHGNISALEDKLTPGTKANPIGCEPDEIRFLRQYSNYLTPRAGLFSADTWALLATYFRNTVLNLAILVALLGAVLIVPRLLSFLAGAWGKDHASLFAWLGAGMALWAVFFIALSISTIPDPVRHQWRRGQTQGSILLFVVLPLLISAFASSIAIWNYKGEFIAIWNKIPPGTEHPVLNWILLPGLAYFGAWAAGWLLAQWHNRNKGQPPMQWTQACQQGFGHFLCALVALGAGALMLTWSVSRIGQHDRSVAALDSPAQGMHLISYGMPFILAIFGLAMILAIGLVGRMYNDKSREWWSRQGGWTAICTIAWFGLAGVSLYAPPVLGWVHANLAGWTKVLIGSAWIGTTLAGLQLGRSSSTGKRGSLPYLELIAALAPLLFTAGALLLVSTLVYTLMLPPGLPNSWGSSTQFGEAFSNYYRDAGNITPARAGAMVLVLVAIGAIIAFRVDVNKFSLYMMYRNRLVRAYLGASNRTRNPHPFTGFDEKDDVQLDTLLATSGIMQRPFPIINAALNLVNGKELAWQTRKAAAFTFTPAFCGFELPSMASGGSPQVTQESARGCFRATAGYRGDKGVRGDEETGIKLGMAVAVSGAAVSPNMGYHSSPALSFLMTLFNVRLGRWFANPRGKSWARPAPRLGIRYLLAELFGMSDSDAKFVYLSDGGHFENLGIYELVRRRCRLIVVIDASADGGLNFEDLGNAMRKCATDLHVEIDIDARQIEPERPEAFSRAYCVVGKILYERTDKDAVNGTLLYVKPALLGTEYADVLNYRKANKDFPHQSTADQWFDETQFESYRSLGYRIGMKVFDLPTGPGLSIPVLAEALQSKWGKKEQEGGTPVAVPVTPAPLEASTDEATVEGEIAKLGERIK
ncbi:MAG: hypothetical protein JWR56_1269 [Massilia sp.]|nr:hypothetical protein [Massilia sp.]